MTASLKTKGIIYDLSPPCAHESNGLPDLMNRTIVMMIRSMTLDCANIIPQVLWAETYSIAIYTKNYLRYSAFKLKKSLYEIMFSAKPSIKYLYSFGTKCYMHVPKQKQIRISKLSPRGIKYYVVGYSDSSKIV
jgi:hypothetical protein